MFDIHHHLLFGLDDGPPDIESSLALARLAVADGITHVVCTPHASGNYDFEPARIASTLAALRAALAAHNIPLTLGSGCDFHLSYDNIQDASANPQKYSVNGGRYLLVELPDWGISPNLSQAFYDLEMSGLVPILTHPERNPTLQRDKNHLTTWVRNGVLLQITAASVLGKMGKTAEKMALQLLDDRWVHFIATDAHNTTSRPPLLTAAREFIARRCGDEYARLVCSTNPRHVFEGKLLPEQPEPLHLYDDDKPKSWWHKILHTPIR